MNTYCRAIALSFGIILHISCIAADTNQSVESPTGFLLLVQHIVEYDDLSDLDAIGKILGFELDRQAETRRVFLRNGRDITRLTQPFVYKPTERTYGHFTSQIFNGDISSFSGWAFKKIGFSGGIDAENFCVTKTAFYDAFNKKIDVFYGYHGNPNTYFYTAKHQNWISIGARFNAEECMTSIGFSQNIERTED